MSRPTVVYEGRQAALKEAPVPAHTLNRCEWCGANALKKRTIRPESKNGDGEVTKPPLEVWVCADHNEMVNRNEEVASVKRKLKIQLRRVGHPKYKNHQEGIVAGIHKMYDRLEELGERVERAA